MAHRRPTQSEVARLAGTSTAVVSYVLNNGPRPVSEETRNRVLAAIAHTGYRPNNLARALVSGKSAALGLIVPDLANPFLAQLAQCFEREFFERGYCLLVGDSQDDLEHEIAVVETMLRQQVDGLVWYSVDQPPPLDVIATSNVPAVILNATESQRIQQKNAEAGRLICVATDERAHAQMATEHLISHGCTRIAHLGGPHTRLNSRERSRGWRDALRQAGLEPAGHCTAPFSREGGFAAASTLSEFNPDGVVVGNEMQAIGLLAALAGAGISIPDDIAIIALNGTDGAEFTVPSLSAIHLSAQDLAHDVVEALLGGNNTENTGQKNNENEESRTVAPVVAHAHLIGRASCGCNEKYEDTNEYRD
ncbi:LacI family DNA-binding transcriptional regulator [Schaalia sp. lx-260]|uniref:LacI family DNA-binding transcriptional regulator n=1 Tax=Schaalia sp. lx-260 TaxID=2899082 RepID=UPI001E362D54|nr:LacI family DNA-binding transcriptional regulator [Schaalia sp. lx-260]MCD4548885.1 LacI family transcriptional regulator [Schaalia sp. lx-260]